jgi:hypothetical protein
MRLEEAVIAIDAVMMLDDWFHRKNPTCFRVHARAEKRRDMTQVIGKTAGLTALHGARDCPPGRSTG